MYETNITKKTIDFANEKLTLETGKMAKQASGSIFLTYGETSILATATVSDDVREGTSFFPLTVDFIEKFYAAGKIPGGFFKREAKPSTNAILNARLVDRAIRPLFPDGFRNAVHVVITVLSYDGKNDPGILGILAASTAISISKIPFHGPISGVSLGLIDDEFITLPEKSQLENSRLDLSVAGTDNSVVMIESGAHEITEEKIIDAIYTAHEEIKKLNEIQHEFVEKAGVEKIEPELHIIPDEIINEIDNGFGKRIKKGAFITGKQDRAEAFDKIEEEIIEQFQEKLDEDDFKEKEGLIKDAFHDLVKKYVRNAILKENHRVDGRTLDEIRPLSCEIDILKRAHGSALFTRGETQSLGAITLGVASDEQIIDGLDQEYRKKYFLHYNFPPFSVGETGFMRAPGRRELGHGMLAERALRPVVPNNDDFPYTIRIVSEILESNGSSSMATVCSGTLSLMAAGVPIRKPVAGIANGLITDNDNYAVLTDIMGLEDHLGDMDFKVTGTEDGITAMQMDIKIEGISREIMEKALEKAKIARMKILDKIKETIPAPRDNLSKYAPRIQKMHIDPSKISELIGQSGKTIKKIIEETNAEINIEDDGTVSIASNDEKAMEKAKEYVNAIVKSPIRGKVYEGIASRIEPYGVFVKFMKGFKEGLVHISKIHKSHVKNIKDFISLGDKLYVKFTGFDRGKIVLSMKGVKGNPEPPKSSNSNHRNNHGRKDS